MRDDEATNQKLNGRNDSNVIKEEDDVKNTDSDLKLRGSAKYSQKI